MRNEIEARGFAVAEAVLSESETQTWREITARIEGQGVSRRQNVFAIRNLLDHPEIQTLARSTQIRALVEPILGPGCFAVRGIFFDKTPDANWKVPWHQDLSIAVREKIEVEGFGPWSEKAGAIHVQPPAEILEQMLTLRLHLDACDAGSGALRVAPGSHLLGKIDSAKIATQTSDGVESVPVAGGGAMLMRPLLLHASSPSQAAHRRVIHLEWAGRELPDGLRWLQQI